MKKNLNKMSARKVALSALLLATMLVLGYFESLLPSPAVPGVKIGLSNSILIFAVYMLNIPSAFMLMALKVILSGLMFGGVSAMMYAAAGGLISMILMCLLSRVKGIHPVVVSMVGGVGHNVGQVGMAMLQTQTTKLVYYMAILMFVGMACGALTGVCATRVMKHMKKLKSEK